MAERNPQIPHSIDSLLYVEKNGIYCGYKLELITDNISKDLREFLICSNCEGIIRRANQVTENTICEMCNPNVRNNAGITDERVQNGIALLNSKCPLRGNGCEWEEKLTEIEQHMEVCTKMLIKCPQNCGSVFERETTEQHKREVCPLRMRECKYCKKQVQANNKNQHIGKCVSHPDTEVPCPYQGLGCDAVVLRKNKERHITGNMIGHQKLMLDQLSQLRNKNQQLEQFKVQQQILNGLQVSQIGNGETAVATINRWGVEIERKRKKRIKEGRIWLIIAFVAAGIWIAISTIMGITVAASQGNNIQANSQQINFISQQISSNSKQIGASLQFIESVMSSLGYINAYIEERGKVLQGREWTHYVNGTSYSGPAFYLEQCKLKVKINASSVTSSSTYVKYYVERVEGDYDDLFSFCRITYTFTKYWNVDGSQRYNDYEVWTYYLDVGDSKRISYSKLFDLNTKIRLRVYFDTEGT